jgi:cytochrome bd-type quinol oxidase subunit 2
MDQNSLALLRKPSALAPLLISLAALALVLGHAAVYGIVHEADEGAAAHIWQILIALEIPVTLAFAAHWWKRARRQTLLVLALLAATLLANFAAVFFLT